MEFALLNHLAADPTRVATNQEPVRDLCATGRWVGRARSMPTPAHRAKVAGGARLVCMRATGRPGATGAALARWL
jgi:hypothetical protein